MAHDHDNVLPSDTAMRVKALETLLAEKGLVDSSAIDTLVELYETRIGPRNGAKVVARAWTDPDYKQRLLTNGTDRTLISSVGTGTDPTGNTSPWVVNQSEGFPCFCSYCSA